MRKLSWIKLALYSIEGLMQVFEKVLGGGLAPFSQTVGPLLIPPGWLASWENDLSIAPMDSAN